MRARALPITILLTLAVLFATPVSASAPPPSLPHYFYGALKIDGADAPIGTTVEARIAGVLNGPFNPITTNQAGKYSDNEPPFTYGLLVQGDITDGASIEFFVNGRKADQTAAWHSGEFTLLNLTVDTVIPPSLAVTTQLASNVGTTTATMNGNLLQTGGAALVTVSFQWGTTQIYGNETTFTTLTAPGTFNTVLSGLVPDTIYHFRAKAVAGQTTAFGVDQLFKTSASAPILPVVGTEVASGVSTTTAVLNGNLVLSGGTVPVTVNFQWGTTLAYGNETAVQTLSAPGAFSAALSSLVPDTLYHFRAKAAAGQAVVFGIDLTFTTSAVSPGGGGVGGGGVSGGGVGGGAPPTTTDTAIVSLSRLSADTELKLDSSGKLQNGTRLRDAEGRVALLINSGTSLKNGSGTPLTAITLTELTSIPPAPPSNAVVMARELGPSGATFDPPIILTLSYTEADLPAGTRESELVIAFWDGSQWVSLPTTVNADTNTLMALVNHFTTFGILLNAGGSVPAASLPAKSASVPVQQTAPATVTAPSVSTSPSPMPSASAPTPASSSPAVGGPNWLLIVGIMAGIIVGLVIALLLRWNIGSAPGDGSNVRRN